MPAAFSAAAASSAHVDDGALMRELARAVDGEVRFDAGSRALYAHDASNYRQVPIGVVVPRTIEGVAAAVHVCSRHAAPLLLRGGGTSQNGQTVNAAVVIDVSKHLNRILDVDVATRTARVEPGVVCDDLRIAAERHGLTFGPDPATHSRCTLGGMIGNNSCGAHSVMSGKTADNVESLDILTYDGLRLTVGPTDEREFECIVGAGGRRGQIYAQLAALRDRYARLIRTRFPKIRRRVSGYNLDQLLPENGFNVARALVGTEGTCALTLQARVRLVDCPPQRVLLVLGYADIYRAADAVPELIAFAPTAIEGLDDRIIGGMRARGLRLSDIDQLPQGNAWVMIEFSGGTVEEATGRARALMAHYGNRPGAPNAWLIVDRLQQQRIWTIRETGASATTLALHPHGPDPAVGWEDAAVDPLRLGNYLREFQTLVDRYGYETSLFGHFGEGCIHARITFDLRTTAGIAAWRGFLREAAELVVEYGGSLSGEHGDGQAKGEFLPIMYGEELMQAFREFKRIWDPAGKMNPGKMIDAYPVDADLRMGPGYRPARPATHFAFATPEGTGFTRALEHCVGMGKCRGKDSVTMCPSYRVTGEERHSTRGRARLLQEMLRGELIADAWQSEAVKEALDLCFACKGCRSDCPTHTDVASYKAEFLSHYHERKRRPRQAYTMGLIAQWSRLAENAPALANFFTQTPVLRDIVKRTAGFAPQRAIPPFAASTFRRWFAAHNVRQNEGRKRVVLWVDTFCNHFHPQVGIAAVEVLEAAGCEVVLSHEKLCCGRPLYDFGMLARAKSQLREIMSALADEIAADTPVIGLEPACITTFKDELVNLFPGHDGARRLSAQVVLFSDFLVNHTHWHAQPLGRNALVHGHCHQKSVLGMSSDLQLLKTLGVDYELLNSGCCGMAGSFGFKPQHYDVSIKAGELGGLLPAVRGADADTLVIANGYSCREQIAQCTERTALHIAEVARLALSKRKA